MDVTSRPPITGSSRSPDSVVGSVRPPGVLGAAPGGEEHQAAGPATPHAAVVRAAGRGRRGDAHGRGMDLSVGRGVTSRPAAGPSGGQTVRPRTIVCTTRPVQLPAHERAEVVAAEQVAGGKSVRGPPRVDGHEVGVGPDRQAAPPSQAEAPGRRKPLVQYGERLERRDVRCRSGAA